VREALSLLLRPDRRLAVRDGALPVLSPLPLSSLLSLLPALLVLRATRGGR
jgi:hypothetical protein